ncbi:uncharacterized protein LOC121863494 [Homarus americanus]|uniref:uncharacterized protein LOC121863494 n=1 Tax=Homarus americanus TaxID=6706 RepID=UPI001C473E6D|nr:uncharacterized protein LOC121863494 [Homarus americanus]
MTLYSARLHVDTATQDTMTPRHYDLTTPWTPRHHDSRHHDTRLHDNTTPRHRGSTTTRLHDSMTTRLHDIMTPRHHDSTTTRLHDNTTPRHHDSTPRQHDPRHHDSTTTCRQHDSRHHAHDTMTDTMPRQHDPRPWLRDTTPTLPPRARRDMFTTHGSRELDSYETCPRHHASTRKFSYDNMTPRARLREQFPRLHGHENTTPRTMTSAPREHDSTTMLRLGDTTHLQHDSTSLRQANPDTESTTHENTTLREHDSKTP